MEKLIQSFSKLSSEAKRSLRTAKFIEDEARSSNAMESLDLSPIIEMLYKSLELTFRDLFESEFKQIIENGELRKKLDIVGYARPIPQQMDRFENYLASLPIIKDIPFFSKFKLRKMLRAICQYRRGKRFTFDGIKAYALFFLLTGRDSCDYGFSKIIQPGFKNESELYMFCSILHKFQDFRNRATHEGFHPDAVQDLSSIWSDIDMIMEITINCKKALSNKDERTISKERRKAV